MKMKDELTELVPSLRKFAYSLTGNMHDADDFPDELIQTTARFYNFVPKHLKIHDKFSQESTWKFMKSFSRNPLEN